MTPARKAGQGAALGLHWVRKELTLNLQLAGKLVEQHAESRKKDGEVLYKALAHVQEVRGVAMLVRAFGLVLLAEEMRQALDDMAASRIREMEAAYAALASACMQASDYLDLVEQRGNESAIVLQPVVNELRLARGKSLLTEDDMFVAQFRALDLHLEHAGVVTPEPGLKAEAERLSPAFAAALLAWFKEREEQKAVSRLGRICELLADASTNRDMHQLWRSAAACVEALLSRGLEPSLELKRQFGRAGQLIKIIAQGGEKPALAKMSDVSLRLLFFVGRATSDGPRVTALRHALELPRWIPSADAVLAARAKLRGANTDLLSKVAEELRADLSEVRVSIDMAMRSGAADGDHEATAKRLKGVADTLMVLGLSAESQALNEALEALGQGAQADADAWMDCATSLLQVDLSLEGALYSQLQAAPIAGGDAGGDTRAAPGLADLRSGISAVLRESLVDLARVKASVETFFRKREGGGLPEAARLLNEIGAGLRMLQLDRVEQQVAAVCQVLQSDTFAAVAANGQRANAFADAVAGIEYFIELERDQSPGREAVLFQVESLLEGFGDDARTAVAAPAAEAPEEVVEAESPGAASEAFDLELVADDAPSGIADEPPAPAEKPEYHLPGDTEPGEEPDAPVTVTEDDADAPLEFNTGPVPVPEPPAQAPAAADADESRLEPDFEWKREEAPAEPGAEADAGIAATASADADEIDPEIREIFIEEAGEVLGSLNTALPGWLKQSDDHAMLGTLRRGFHTLKGSGRMVGADAFGEFAWAVENLLNRCLDRTIAVSPAIINLVEQAVALVPSMIAAFRERRPAPEQALALGEQAHALASPDHDAGDEDLAEVFRTDALARLQMVLRWLGDLRTEEGPHAIPEPVLRAFHTLRGAAAAIGGESIATLCGAIEDFLENEQKVQGSLGANGLAAVDDCCTTLNQWIGRFGNAAAANQDVAPWLSRLAEVASNAAAAGADEDQQLAEVFAFEALDLVQKFEGEMQAWVQSPAKTGGARTLKGTMHTLKGAAATAGCAPIAALAQALNLRLGELEGAPAPAGFLAAMRPLVDGFYQQLDDFRAGKLDGDGSEWVARVMVLEFDGVDTEAAPGVAPVAFSETMDPQDAELLYTFLGEATQLMETLEEHAGAIADRPDDRFVQGEWLRALHTLKGGARMAGLDVAADLAHRLEDATAEAQHCDGPVLERFREQVRLGVDGLHEIIDGARRPGTVDGERVLARFDAVSRTATDRPPPAEAPAFDGGDAPLELPELPELPVDDEGAVPAWSGDGLPELDLSQPDDAVPPPAAPDPGFESDTTPLDLPGIDDGPAPVAEAAPVPPPAPAPAPAPEESVDPDLLEIFAPEAQELLESLQRAMGDWRDQPGNAAYPAEMQRHLHTFKGGARMTGLKRLGDAAHALETRLVELERGGADAAALIDVNRELDGLQQLYETGQAPPSVPVASPVPPPAVEPSPPPPPPELVEEEVAEDPNAAPLSPGAMPPPPADVSHLPTEWDPKLFWRPEGEAALPSEMRREAVRVPVERLDAMLNQAGEISIYHSRLEENHANFGNALAEMDQTVVRIREQLRMMEVETEAQIAARGFSRATEEDRYEAEFDALEMDRYSRMQELSRALAESVSDLQSLHSTLDNAGTEAETLLQQQGRINNEVQQGLMGTLMVPFSRQVQRLSRVVRQTAEQNGKAARAEFSGTDSEMDRNVLERMTAPLEHLLRNCVVHGIEMPDVRKAAGKNESGVVSVSLKREGSQLLLEVRDDGKGLDFASIRAQAVKRGLMREDAEVSDEDLARFVFAPGFSTAKSLTQDAGRGIGMDVVAAEVKQLGGTVELSSETGRGARFTIRLPLMLAVSQALVVQVGEEYFAIPLTSVEGIARAPREELEKMMREDGHPLEYAGNEYQVRRLGELVGLAASARNEARSVPAILMRIRSAVGGAERRIAVVADRLIGNREIVSKAAGPVLGSVAGVSGATLMADGTVMLILDIPALIQESVRRRLGDEAAASQPTADDSPRTILVVDDSITIRRVTERLLTRKGYRVMTARDGVDAMSTLQTETPDAILLDIEMPRADGFEVAAFIRNTPRLTHMPILMITSRSGDKHREHARQIGVDKYLIKPFQEEQLLSELRKVLGGDGRR